MTKLQSRAPTGFPLYLDRDIRDTLNAAKRRIRKQQATARKKKQLQVAYTRQAATAPYNPWERVQ